MRMLNVFQMSASGAVMISVIIILRATLLHKLPKRTFNVLWFVTALRLVLPFSVPSVYSIYSLLGHHFDARQVSDKSIRTTTQLSLVLPETIYHVYTLLTVR